MAVLRECENYREQCLLTHTPRLSKNVRGFGFDQSALLARETAEHLFLPYSALFCRNTGTTEQKQLTRGARMENAENAYRLRSGAAERIAGRTVVIIDDVITTGSTVGVCGCTAQACRGGICYRCSRWPGQSLEKRSSITLCWRACSAGLMSIERMKIVLGCGSLKIRWTGHVGKHMRGVLDS